MFCFDLLTNKVDCSDLLFNLNLHCPTRSLRDNMFLRPSRHATNYAKFSPINIMNDDFNLVKDIFEFNMNRNRFKKMVLSRLSDLL